MQVAISGNHACSCTQQSTDKLEEMKGKYPFIQYLAPLLAEQAYRNDPGLIPPTGLSTTELLPYTQFPYSYSYMPSSLGGLGSWGGFPSNLALMLNASYGLSSPPSYGYPYGGGTNRLLNQLSLFDLRL